MKEKIVQFQVQGEEDIITVLTDHGNMYIRSWNAEKGGRLYKWEKVNVPEECNEDNNNR